MTSQAFIEIATGYGALQFKQIALNFLSHGLTNLFGTKNNKTLSETVEQPRYKALSTVAVSNYRGYLCIPVGTFLVGLKLRGDDFYRRFLNPHGDERYCTFRMDDCTEKRLKGLYLFTLEDTIVYIGRSYDPFGKRVDQGYGKIHPKNCFIDGQSTNCHLNSLIESRSSTVSFYVCPLTSDAEIATIERTLIQFRKPIWNVALAK